MTELNRTTFGKDNSGYATASLSRIEEMMNARQDLITRHAEHYGIEIDKDNRVTGDVDLLDFDPDAYDEWAEATSNMRVIRETAAAFGCEVSRGEDGAWHATQTQTRNSVIGVSHAVDPKGRVVLQRIGKDALLFRGGKYQPFVVAHRYDEKTGEWSHGNYLDTVAEAVEALGFKATRTRSGRGERREAGR